MKLWHVVLLVACAAFVVFMSHYLLNTQRPGVLSELGYYRHSDVRQHESQAESYYLYGHMGYYMYAPLYSVIGSFFYDIYPRDIFLIPNIVYYLGSMIAVFLISNRLFSRNIGLLVTFLNIISVTILEHYVFPWATSLSSLFILWNIYFTLLLASAKIPKRRILFIVLISIGSAATYYTRFGLEFLLSVVPMAVYLVYTLVRQRNFKQFFAEGLLYVGIVTVILSPLLWLHYVRFGHPFATQYSFIEIREGVSWQSLEALEPEKIISSVGEVVFGYNYLDATNPSVIYQSPMYLIFFISLFVVPFYWKRLSSDQQIVTVSIYLFMLISIGFYASYPAFRGETVKYGCIHYIRTTLILSSFIFGSAVWLYLEPAKKRKSRKK